MLPVVSHRVHSNKRSFRAFALLFWFSVLRQPRAASIAVFVSVLCLLFVLQIPEFSRFPSIPRNVDSRDASYRADKENFIKLLHAWDAHASVDVIPPIPARVLVSVSHNNVDTLVLPKRTLVIYSYSHATWRQENLEFFLRHGLVTHTVDGGEVDYTFVFNGYESPDSFQTFGIKFTSTYIAKGDSLEKLLETKIPTIEIETSGLDKGRLRPRVHAVFRENSGFDICSSRIVIEYALAPRSGTYTHLVLMNGSVRGPFLPSYVLSTWIDMFQQFLQNNIRLVGTTINCMSDFYDIEKGFTSLHAQSMVLALDAVGVHALLPVLQCYTEYTEAINHGEIGISQSILKAGYGIAALQSSWRGFSIFQKDLNSSEVKKRCAAVSENTGGDPNFPGVYLEGTIHPLEVIFVKTNRKLDPEILKHETVLSDVYNRTN
jgi:hypothetical protein